MFTKRRKGRAQRIQDVALAVEELDKGEGVTMRKVARRIGLQPSSHMLSLLEDTAIVGKIDMTHRLNSRGHVTYYYYRRNTNAQ